MTNTSGGSAEKYFNLLETEEDSGKILTRFYCGLFNVPFTTDLKIAMNNNIKVFGKYITYFSIIDIFGMISRLENRNKPDALLSYFCKKRFEKETHPDNSPPYENLTGKIEEIEKKIKEITNGK